LKLQYVEPLSNFGFNIKVRRYSWADLYLFPADYGTFCQAGAYTRPLISSTCDVFGHCNTESAQHVPQKALTLS
jgi:hypothetical protein